MVLALKPGTKIAAKTGNPAGLLFRRIWYSVGKSGVLGITEYRQGRPLVYFCKLIRTYSRTCELVNIIGEHMIIYLKSRHWVCTDLANREQRQFPMCLCA